ncbi:MAG TPA: hypothetical protein VIC84_00785, partial [Blastocatellia bacterium]
MMRERGNPEYEYSEAVHNELKRLIESATANPPGPSPAVRGGWWLLMAVALLSVILVFASVRSHAFRQPGAERDSTNSPKSDVADDVMSVTSKQALQIVVEPVSEKMNSAGHGFLVVPDSAVILFDSKFSVFVEEPAGRYRLRNVQARPGQGGLTVIENGLRAGERVVTHGAILLTTKIRK